MVEDGVFVDWQEKIAKQPIPYWDELPAVDLYMDQLVSYVNRLVTPLNMPVITATMVNNYVKKKVIFAPVKKKYQAMQIADVIIISLSKSLFSLDEIRQAIDVITKDEYPKKAYDRFVDALRLRFKGEKPIPVPPSMAAERLMQDVADLVYQKLEAEFLLDQLVSQNGDR